jgi:hypothetical protein
MTAYSLTVSNLSYVHKPVKSIDLGAVQTSLGSFFGSPKKVRILKRAGFNILTCMPLPFFEGAPLRRVLSKKGTIYVAIANSMTHQLQTEANLADE